MERDTAVRLVGKLRALAADKAATPGEAATATAKADRLVAKFGLRAEPRPMPNRPRVVRPAPAAGFKGWSSSSPLTGSPLSADRIRRFDPKTGVSSDPRVKVHEYKSPSNWRIEIF